jgi:hypothetical protein
VRHDGRANNPDGQRDGSCAMQAWQHAARQRRMPIGRCDRELADEAEPDRGDKQRNHDLDRPETALIEQQDRGRDHAGDDEAG